FEHVGPDRCEHLLDRVPRGDVHAPRPTRLYHLDSQSRREPDALRLSRRALGNRFEKYYSARAFVCCKSRRDKIAQRALRNRARSSQNNRGCDFLAQCRMLQCEGQRLRHRWMIQQYLIDLDRRDLLAATVDQLLEPSMQEEIAVA